MVQADYLNGLIDDTVYVKIQGTPYGIPGTEVSDRPGDGILLWPFESVLRLVQGHIDTGQVANSWLVLLPIGTVGSRWPSSA